MGIQFPRPGGDGRRHVSIAGGDSWVGILFAPDRAEKIAMFQSQVAILGWGYNVTGLFDALTELFQSQVAILGWGYLTLSAGGTPVYMVSIAGGDSWVGIHSMGLGRRRRRLVSIAGGDSWVGILFYFMLFSLIKCRFNRRWRFLGGDTAHHAPSAKRDDCFNRRWRFLGGDTAARGTTPRHGICCFNRRWRFLGGDTSM